MTDRVLRLREKLHVDKFPLVTEKAKIVIDSYDRNNGRPAVIMRAIATAEYLDKRTIFIEPDELVIGNIASVPMGMEVGCSSPAWPDDDLDDILAGGQVTISDEDRKVVRSLDKFWEGRFRTQEEWQGYHYDDGRLWPFIKKGFLCPPWNNRTTGRGLGAAGLGWGLGLGPTCLITPDYQKVVDKGLGCVVTEAEEELKKLRYYSADEFEKADYLKAILIVFPAIIRLAKRYAALAEDMATKEKDPVRAAELRVIAETCRRVPEQPARTLREAVQSFFFYWVMIASGTAPGGRFDQYMYPYYKADIEAGRLTRDEAVELVECLRLKIMQLNFLGGGKNQREKWAGMARWHNFVIGGCDRDGKNAVNELSYILLDAAEETMTPHPTLTVRVGKDTPPEFLRRALEVVRTGIGMPAFVSEQSYINFIVNEGVDVREARDFVIAGCLDVMLPGKSRNNAFGMLIVPMILELVFNNGRDAKTGELLGEETGRFEDFKTYDEFYAAFLKQAKHIVGEVVEEHNILLMTHRALYPDVVHSALLEDGVKCGKDGLNRRMMLENCSCVNMVGMINTADCLEVIKKLVYDERRVSPAQLNAALAADWQGYEDVQKLCMDAPKYGNNIDEVDSIAARLFSDMSDTIRGFKNVYGTPVLPAGISITAHAPGGKLTGATPDGRRAGETFADGSVSPVQGCDVCGPTAVFNSALHINHDLLTATLMNMKFHPSALKTEEDLDKLGLLVRTYLTCGGKHVQFNVVNKDVLRKAQADKQQYRDLVVRVAGYSAYFVTLTRPVQEEIIARTEHSL